jgi:23S rRNA pseudouridine1911/1915/1917 synthase
MDGVEVLWSDDQVLVVSKPAGTPAQPDLSGDPDMLTILRARSKEPGLGLVHRLDRPVSGVMVFGRTPEAIASLSRQFQERRITKVYWAIVEGRMEGDRTLMHKLERDPRERRSRISVPDASDAKIAELVVSALAVGERYTLVRIEPKGGAFHQIRAQLSAAGHPIKGDVKYGARRGERDRRIALHAHSLTFHHPVSGHSLTCTASSPTGSLWATLIGQLGASTGS